MIVDNTKISSRDSNIHFSKEEWGDLTIGYKIGAISPTFSKGEVSNSIQRKASLTIKTKEEREATEVEFLQENSGTKYFLKLCFEG